MSSILIKIQEELDNIHISQKLNSGNVLTENDIKSFIKILKDKDIEVKPLLILIEKLLLNNKDNYLLIEKTIIELLKYYNLLDNSNFNSCRHKYFFSEQRKLIKTKYFTEEHKKGIQTQIQNIYKKL